MHLLTSAQSLKNITTLWTFSTRNELAHSILTGLTTVPQNWIRGWTIPADRPCLLHLSNWTPAPLWILQWIPSHGVHPTFALTSQHSGPLHSKERWLSLSLHWLLNPQQNHKERLISTSTSVHLWPWQPLKGLCVYQSTPTTLFESVKVTNGKLPSTPNMDPLNGVLYPLVWLMHQQLFNASWTTSSPTCSTYASSSI